MAVIGNFLMNSQAYVIKYESDRDRTRLYRRHTERAFLDAETNSGQKDIESIRPHDSRVYYAPHRGLGVDRIPSDESKNPLFYRRCFKNTCDIRWPNISTLPLLAVDATETNLEVLRASADYKGNLIGLWEDDTSTDIVSAIYTGSTDTWDGTPDTINAEVSAQVGLDMVVDGNTLIALFAFANDLLTYISTNGTSWTVSTTQPAANRLSDSVGVHEDIDGGLMALIAGELVGAFWDEPSKLIDWHSSTDSGDNWTDETAPTPAIESLTGIKGVAVVRGTDGLDKIIVAVDNGLHEIDTSPTVWTTRHIHKMSVHADNGRRMTVGADGAVWFARGVSDDEPFEVFRLFVGVNSQWVVEPVVNSPHLQDGLPSEWLGTVRWMKNAHGFMYMTVGGGAASRQGGVFCHNGFGWSNIYEREIANVKLEWMEISTADGTQVKLLWSERDSSAVSDTKVIDDIASNPTSGVGINYELTGIIDLPIIDGGMPNIDSAMLEARISADNLSATNSNEFINMDFAGDDEARGANDLGDFLSGTKALKFAAGVGVSTRTLAPRLNLHQDDDAPNNDTPKFRSLEIDYRKKPAKVESWRIMVDLVATSALTKLPIETIITNIQTAQALVTLVSFSYANSGTKFVDVDVPEWREEAWEDSSEGSVAAPNTKAIRRGTVELVLEERI